MFRKLPAVIALALLLTGCGSTTKPSVSITAPETKLPPPANLLTLPVPPEPLVPGYAKTH